MITEDGWIYTGTVWMGRQSAMDLVFDTGSDWLVVEGSQCVNCEGDRYDISGAVDRG